MQPILSTTTNKRGSDAAALGGCLAIVLVIALFPLSAAVYWHGLLAFFSAVTISVLRVPAAYMFSRGLLIVPGLIAAMLILPLIGRGETVPVFGIGISLEGLRRGSIAACKLLGIMCWLSWITWKLPPQRMFPAMESLRFPRWLIAILRSTYSNFSILSREVSSMRQALRSRIVHRGTWLIQATGKMLSLLFVRTRVRAASQVIACDSRCNVDDSPVMSATSSIEIENVSYCYPGASENALHGICLEIPAQAKVAILGCNGAGKTTLLLHLNAVFPLQSGRITIGGIALSKSSRSRIREEVGMLFQNPDDQILGLTVEEDVAIGPRQLRISETGKTARIESALRQAGLWNRRDQPPHKLSGGERKRLALAGGIAGGGRVLLLDEPMAGLDSPGRDEITVILDDLHRAGKTIIAATHDVDFAAEWASMVVVMDSGRIIAAGPPDMLTDARLMASAGLSMSRLAEAFAAFYAECPDVEMKLPGTRKAVVEWLRKRIPGEKIKHNRRKKSQVGEDDDEGDSSDCPLSQEVIEQ